MDLVVCPHCFTRVIPMDDGACPRCRRRIDRVAEFEPVTVRSGSRLPKCCAACGAPTSSLRRWSRAKPLTFGESVMLGRRGPLAPYRDSLTIFVSFAYSTCEGCWLPAEPRPRFDEGLVELVIHRDCARLLKFA